MNRRRLKKALKRAYYLPQNKFLSSYLKNKVKHFFYKISKSTKVSYPSTLMIELTNHCNLSCTICPREYQYGKDMDKGRMSIELAKKIIDEEIPYLDSIGLTGMGETFMYSNLLEIVNYIKSKNKGVIISVSTNAVLPNFIEKVKPLIGKLDTIQISVDGLNGVYNSIRLNSNFDTLNNNLHILSDLCQSSSTDLMINMVVTKENFTQMADLVKYAESVGVSYVDFTILNLASITEIPVEYYDFYKSPDFLNALDELENVVAQTKHVIVTKRNFEEESGFKKCFFPWTHFYVTFDGYITPCCAKPFPKEKNFGNLKDLNLIDILNSNEFINWRELWFKNITPEFCKKCHYIDLKPIKK